MDPYLSAYAWSTRPTTDMPWYMVWPGGHDMVYSMAYWVWHGGDGRIYGMIWQAWHGIWYGLAGMAFFMVCLVVWHGIWYGLGEHGVVYGITWVDMAWYMV